MTSLQAATDAFWQWASKRQGKATTEEAFEAGFVQGGKYALRASASLSGLCHSLRELIALLEEQEPDLGVHLTEAEEAELAAWWKAGGWNAGRAARSQQAIALQIEDECDADD